MITVLPEEKEGYALIYRMTAGDGKQTYGGIKLSGELAIDDDCPFKELILRSIIFRMQNTVYVEEVFSQKNYGLPLEQFGFKKENGVYRAKFEEIHLPKCH